MRSVSGPGILRHVHTAAVLFLLHAVSWNLLLPAVSNTDPWDLLWHRICCGRVLSWDSNLESACHLIHFSYNQIGPVQYYRDCNCHFNVVTYVVPINYDCEMQSTHKGFSLVQPFGSCYSRLHIVLVCKNSHGCFASQGGRHFWCSPTTTMMVGQSVEKKQNKKSHQTTWVAQCPLKVGTQVDCSDCQPIEQALLLYTHERPLILSQPISIRHTPSQNSRLVHWNLLWQGS